MELKYKHTGTCIICDKRIVGKTSDDWYWNLLTHIFSKHAELTPEAKAALKRKNVKRI